MTRGRPWLFVPVFASLFSWCAYGQVIMVRDRPFTALKTIMVDRAGEQYTVTAKMARNREGSTYFEVPNAKDPTAFMVIIQNLPRKETILLYPKEREYTVQQMPFSNLPQQPALPAQIEDQKKAYAAVKPDRQTREDGSEVERVPLGFRTEEGFVEFGDRRTYRNLPSSSDLKEKVWETWTILGEALTAEQSSFDDHQQLRTDTKLTSIATDEPDPKLFEIPDGYTLKPAPSSRAGR